MVHRIAVVALAAALIVPLEARASQTRPTCVSAMEPHPLGQKGRLSFSDDFEGPGPKSGLALWWRPVWFWVPEQASGVRGYNDELQFYINPFRPELDGFTPFSTSQGMLRITARPTPLALRALAGDAPYVSGLINSQGTFDQTYGYFEMRAKVPKGRGLWPAFWLMPSDGTQPEIDVFEMLGNDVRTYYATIHSPKDPPHTWQKAIETPDLSQGFHTFGVDWQKDFITFYFDRSPVFGVKTPSDMHSAHYVIANLAVGGNWPGNPDASTQFPAVMDIDYIKAWTSEEARDEPARCDPEK